MDSKIILKEVYVKDVEFEEGITIQQAISYLNRFSKSCGYDNITIGQDNYGGYCFRGDRLETDEECSNRIRKETSTETRKLIKRNKDLAEYQRLKALFEGTENGN